MAGGQPSSPSLTLDSPSLPHARPPDYTCPPPHTWQAVNLSILLPLFALDGCVVLVMWWRGGPNPDPASDPDPTPNPDPKSGPNPSPC